MASQSSRKRRRNDVSKRCRVNKLGNPSDETSEGKGHRMTLIRKLMLSAELLGMESVTNYQQIYTVPILQTLGMPISLSYISPLVTGPTSLLLLPLLGWLIDRGHNPLRRKFASIVLAAALEVLGMLCLLLANALHLWYLLDYNAANGTGSTASGGTLNSSAGFPDVGMDGVGGELAWNVSWMYAQGNAGVSADSAGMTPTAKASSEGYKDGSETVPFKAGLGMLGLILMDLGFDCSNSFVKAFMVTCSVRADHNSLFMMGVVMGSIGGVTNAAMGVIDLTSLLGLSSIEGGRLAIQCSIQGLIIILLIGLGLLSTFCTGRKQLRELHEHGVRAVPTEIHENDHYPGSAKSIESRPSKDSMSFHETSAIFNENNPDLNPHAAQRENPVLGALENSIRSFGGSSVYMDPSVTLVEDSPSSLAEDVPLLEEDTLREEEEEEESEVSSRSVGGYGAADSVHQSKGETSFAAIPVEDAGGSKSEEGERGRPSCLQNPKVRILLVCITMLFSADTVAMFSYCVSDLVGKVVYGGDPSAEPGSESLNRYQEGMKMASWSLLVYFCTYFVTSIVHPRILALLGFRVEFVLLQFMMVTTLFVTSMISRMETVFVLSVVAGIHRTCIYTTPYAITNNIAQTIVTTGSSRNPVGLAMSLLAASVPMSFCLLFSWVGAIVDLIGDVAAPLWLGGTWGVIGIIVFLFLGKV